MEEQSFTNNYWYISNEANDLFEQIKKEHENVLWDADLNRMAKYLVDLSEKRITIKPENIARH